MKKTLTVVFVLVTVFLAILGNASESRFKLIRANFHIHGKDSIFNRHQHGLEKARGWLYFVDTMDHLLAQTLEKTIATAKKILLDAISSSDHDVALDGADWKKQAEIANAAKGIIVLRGFEYTGEHYSHFTVLGSDSFISARLRFGGYGIVGADGTVKSAPDLSSFYKWVIEEGKNSADLICIMNHPDRDPSHFNDFEMPDPVLDEYITLMEVSSGPTVYYSSIKENEKYLIRAFQRGHHVGPTSGTDNFFSLTHKEARARHTGVWLDSRDSSDPKEQLMSALAKRRTFASEDADFSMMFWAKIEGDQEKYYLGDRVDVSRGKMMNLHAELSSSDDAIGKLRLVEIRKNDFVEKDFCKTANITGHSFTGISNCYPSRDTLAYYLKVIQADGDEIVCAPISVEVTMPELHVQARGTSNENDPLQALRDADDFKFELILCDGYSKDAYGRIIYNKTNSFKSGVGNKYLVVHYVGLKQKYRLPCKVKTKLFTPKGAIITNEFDVHEGEPESAVRTAGPGIPLKEKGRYTVEGYINNDLWDRQTFELR